MPQHAAQMACLAGIIFLGGMQFIDLIRHGWNKNSSGASEAGIDLFLTGIFGLLLYKAGAFTTLF